MSSDSTAIQSRSDFGGADFPSAADLSLVEMMRVVSRYKLLAVSVAITIFAGSIAYAFVATPVYRAELMLAPVRTTTSPFGGMMSQFGGTLGALAGMVGMSSSGRLSRGEAYAALTSTAQVQGFIDEQNLLPVLFSDLWDPEKEEWMVDDPEKIPTLSDGYDMFMNELLTAEEDPTTGLVIVGLEWKDPVQAASWANALVGNLNKRLRDQAINDADKTIDFLNQELERTKVVELRQAIFYMMEQQVSSKTTARVQDEFAFKIINPAIAPDLDKYVRPKRVTIIIGGLVLGLLGAILAAFLAFAIAHLRREYQKSNRA